MKLPGRKYEWVEVCSLAGVLSVVVQVAMWILVAVTPLLVMITIWSGMLIISLYYG